MKKTKKKEKIHRIPFSEHKITQTILDMQCTYVHVCRTSISPMKGKMTITTEGDHI